MRILSICLLLHLAVLGSLALNSTVCNYKLFPLFAGGSKNEYVNTMEIDTTNNYILVGGKT